MERPNTQVSPDSRSFAVPLQLPRCKWRRGVRRRLKCRKHSVNDSDFCELHLEEMELRKLGMNTPRHVKRRIHCIVLWAIKKRRLIPQPCERCGIAPIDLTRKRRVVLAHHEDYSRPLEVNWLCNVCHRQRHLELDPNFTGNVET